MKLLLLFLYIPVLLCSEDSIFHNFERLVFWNNKSFFGQNSDDFAKFQRVYLNKIDAFLDCQDQDLKIPKVFHFIWLGPKPFPQTSVLNLQSWMQHHPGWVFKFWTDSFERSVPLPGMEHHHIHEIAQENQMLYDRSDNYGEKSDLLRYELLFQEGGVYVDHDVFCYRNFDQLNKTYHFYTFMEPPHINLSLNVIFFPSNGLIGSVPHHPILARTMEYVRMRWDEAIRAFSGRQTAMRRAARVMYCTFHSFYLGVRDLLEDAYYENILFPPAFTTSKVYGGNVDYSILFCDHYYAGSWIEEDTKKSKKGR